MFNVAICFTRIPFSITWQTTTFILSGLSFGAIKLQVACWKKVETDVVRRTAWSASGAWELAFLPFEISFYRRSYLQCRCSDIRLPFSNRQEMNQLCVWFWRVLNFSFNSETMLKDSVSFRSKALDSSFSNNYTLNSYWTRLLSDLIFLLISSRYTQTARPLTARRKF